VIFDRQQIVAIIRGVASLFDGAPFRGVGLIPRLTTNERLVKAFAEEARAAVRVKEAFDRT
jgi:hypothetical protein